EKFACSDVLDRCSQSIKHYWNLPGEKVGKRWPAASVRYMLHVHASHGLEQLAVDMLRASGTTGRHVNLAGIRLGVRDELGKRLSRERRVDYQDAESGMRARDRRDIAQDIEIELIVERDVPTISRSKLQEGVAIRGRSHDCLGSNIAARTRPVFDDELLTKVLRQPLTEKTCKQVRHAPRRKSNDQADRPCRIGLGPCDARPGLQRGTACGQVQKLTAGKFHFEPPFTSFDHLVGARDKCRRNFQAERFRSAEVDDQLKFGWLHN